MPHITAQDIVWALFDIILSSLWLPQVDIINSYMNAILSYVANGFPVIPVALASGIHLTVACAGDPKYIVHTLGSPITYNQRAFDRLLCRVGQTCE